MTCRDFKKRKGFREICTRRRPLFPTRRTFRLNRGCRRNIGGTMEGKTESLSTESTQPLAAPPAVGVAKLTEFWRAALSGRTQRDTPSLKSFRMVRRFSTTTRSHDDFF